MAQAMKKHVLKDADTERGPEAAFFLAGDKADLAREVERVGAKSVLEFGPGDSTQTFLDIGVEKIVTCENIDKWLGVAKDRFKKDKRVTVLKFEDEFPVTVDGLGDEMFDIGFVDAPKGFNPVRKVHPGFADCSRLNTLAFALDRCKVVLLHDAKRPLERGSLGRLWSTGLFDIEFIPNKIGMARITRREQNKDGPNPQDAKELGGSSPRPKPKRRRVPVSKRPDRLDSGRAEGETGLPG
jgi:hypothetical protein